MQDAGHSGGIQILVAHLHDDYADEVPERMESYGNLQPDRVALQDATAQMALLQFMNSGMQQTSVPTTVHCDHLIQAKTGALEDLNIANKTNREVYDFLSSVSFRLYISNTVSGRFLKFLNTFQISE